MRPAAVRTAWNLEAAAAWPFSMTDGTQCLQLTAHGADRRKGVNKYTKDVTAEGGESCGDQELVIQEEGTACAKAQR